MFASRGIAIVLACLATTGTAYAVTAPSRVLPDDPGIRLDALTVPRPVVTGSGAMARTFTPANEAMDPVHVRERAASSGLARWAGTRASRFVVTSNAWTGLPHRLYGPALSIATGPLTRAAAADAAARAFLLSHTDVWAGDERPGADELALVKSKLVGRTWFLVYQQRHMGADVLGGRVDVRLTTDGRLVLLGSDWMPGVRANPNAARAPLGVSEARARQAIAFDASRDRDLGGVVAILPLPTADGGLDYRVVHRVRHRTIDPPALWVSDVDANSGEILARENQVRFDTLVGAVTGRVHPSIPTDPLVALPLRDAVLTTTLDSVFTGADGRYSFPGISFGTVIRAGLRGPFEEITRFTPGTSPFQQASAPANDTLDFVWQFPNADSSEADVFYHVAETRQAIKRIEPGFNLLDYRMPVTPNIPAVCNAYWDGVGVNFFRWGLNGSGVACANTGMIADVVYHEYGHGRTQFVWDPLSPSGAMHEGLSDYLAATMMNQPVIGRGFNGPGTFLRSTQNAVQVNQASCAGEVHCVGNAISGAMWDTRRNLIASLGDSATAIELADSLFHFSGYGGAPWHDDWLLDLLVVDDNDGVLVNGTPHSTAICAAFAAHGIPCPTFQTGVWVDVTPIPDQDLGGPFHTLARVGSPFDDIVAGQVVIHWRAWNGLWHDNVMTPVGGQEYDGTLGPFPAGGRIDWYVTAADGSGNGGSSPANPPAEFHTFYVGTKTNVFADDMEVDRGWTSATTAATGRWMRVEPHGTPDPDFPTFYYAPETDHTPDPAQFCWVTGDTTAGLDVGAADVDGGCVYLTSPLIDLSGLDNAHLEYWRWFTDESRYDDTLRVEVTANNGTNWILLEGQPFTENVWTHESFDLGSVLPLTNQFRMRVKTCDVLGGSLLEAAFDDVVLSTRTYGAVAVEDPDDGVPSVAFLGAAEPNPSRAGAGVRIAYGVPRSAAATLQIVDLRGRVVRTLVAETPRPGRYSALWDGATDNGGRAAPGVYFVRYVYDGVASGRKLVRLD